AIVMVPRPMRETSSPPREMCFMRELLCGIRSVVPGDRTPSVASGVRIVVRERRRQFPVGVGLGEQVVGFLLNGRDGVGSCCPAKRRFVLARELNQRLGELSGVAGLRAAHTLPSS